MSDVSLNLPSQPGTEWWRDAVIYQVYPRSFNDTNGDGIGDLAGVTDKLPYLKRLGVDAVWLSPFYVSPQHDAGYDVADYRAVDPLFGSLEDFDRMRDQAHELGLKLIVDLVPNHTSEDHEWFRDAREAPPGSPERQRYMFREGTGHNGQQPPNNWQSLFGGPAWTQVPDGQWYLHLFDSTQPDLNWDNPEVWDEFRSILRFWLDRGADGFRVDVAHGLVKAAGLPDWDGEVHMVEGADSEDSPDGPGGTAPFLDQEGVHEVYRDWNAVLQEYPGDRMLVVEAWVSPAQRLARYVRADEAHQAFNFDFLMAGWHRDRLLESIKGSLRANGGVGATSTWVLSNHDTVRHASRYGLTSPASHLNGIGPDDEQPDAALGLRRARAAALVELSLPGSAYIYQGDELGLPEHTELEAHHRQDPTFFRTGGEQLGRDGARVPLPWSPGEHDGLGFGPNPWLPQPVAFHTITADHQVGDPQSVYNMYRNALRVRHDMALGRSELTWHPLTDHDSQVLAYRLTTESGDMMMVAANMGTRPVEVAEVSSGRVVLVSDQSAIHSGYLNADHAVWIAL